MLVNAKIKRLVSFGSYNDSAFTDLFREAEIEVVIRKRPSSRISFLD
jgi:dCMP deaminase